MASPQVPSSSRLVSKLAVHGRVSAAAAGQQPSSPALDGVLISLFCKVNVPHAPANSSQSYPLFPDHRVRLLSSHTHPLSHHSALSLSPPPPTVILAAATHLRIGTTFDDPNPTSSSASTRSAPTVKVAVQDFAVCLVTEGGSAGAGTPVAGRKAGRKSNAFSPTPTEGESSPWIVVLELLVPWLSKPPLDRTAILVPLPRCLSNTLSFHLLLPPQAEGDNDEYSFMTAPKLLSSSSAPSTMSETDSTDDLVLQGTFQSTPQLEIRWKPAPPPAEADSSTAGVTHLALLQNLAHSVEWSIKSSTINDDAAPITVDLKASFEGDLHYAGVESIAHLEVAFQSPPTQIMSWYSPPSFGAGRGLAGFQPCLDSSLPSNSAPDDLSFDTTISTIQSPSPSHARTKTTSQTSTSSFSSFLRTASGGSSSGGQSSSLPSLLRQQMPLRATDSTGTDISFTAFDATQSPSPGPSPVSKHQSPLSQSDVDPRRARLTSNDHRMAKCFRVAVEVSKVHEVEGAWRLDLSGSLELTPGEDGTLSLPLLTLHSLGDTATSSRVLIRGAEGWEIGPPPGSIKSSVSSRTAASWVVPLVTNLQASTDFFTLSRPTPATAASSRDTTSATLRHYRGSSLASTQAFNRSVGASASLPVDPASPFWVSDQSVSSAECIPSVDLEVLLLPSSDGSNVQQLTSMTVILPLLASPTDFAGENDTFEFGIITSPSTGPGSSSSNCSYSILSAAVNAVPVSYDLQLSDEASLEKEGGAMPGALGYVQLRAEGLRTINGEIKVKYLVQHSVEKKKGRAQKAGVDVVLGLPSFEKGVSWQETRVQAADGFALDITASTSTLVSMYSSGGQRLRLVSHSSPPLSAPHLQLSLRPALSTSPRRASTFSLPVVFGLLLVLWLLASVGMEVKSLQDQLLHLRVDLQHARSGNPISPADDVWTREVSSTIVLTHTSPVLESSPPSVAPAASSSSTTDHLDPLSLVATSHSILRPSFTDLPLPPPPSPSSPGPAPPPAPDALSRPINLAHLFPSLHAYLLRAGNVLEGHAVGRGLKGLVVGVGRVLSYIFFG